MYKILMAIVFATAVAIAAPVCAQTWTGQFFGVWNQGLNWSPTGIPNSPTADVNFTGNSIGGVNISSSVQARSLNFSNPTGAYTLTSDSGVSLSGVSTINIAAGVTGMQTIDLASIGTGSLRYPIGSDLTILNNSTAAGKTLTIGQSTVINSPGFGGVLVDGIGTTEISGPYLAGPGILNGLAKYGAGTLILSSSQNTYGNLTDIYGGRLMLGTGTANPAGRRVRVFHGEFNIGSLSNTESSRIELELLSDNATFRVPSGVGDYYVSQLLMTGGTLDFSGTDNFWLRFTGSTSQIIINNSATTANWIGDGLSRIRSRMRPC